MNSAYLSLLRKNPKLRVLLIALIVSVIGDVAYFVVLAGVLLGAHHTAVFSISVAAEVLGGIAMLPFAGVIVDRYDRLRVMIGSDLVQAIVVLGAYVALRAGVFDAAPVVSLLLGAASAFFTPAVGALVPQLAQADDLVTANALRSLATKASGLIGPALAGVVLVLSTGMVLVLADAISFIVSAALLVCIGLRHSWRPEPNPAQVQEPSMVREALAGLAFVRSKVWIAAIMVQGVFQVGFVLGPEIVLVPIFLSHHHETHLYGFVLSAQAAGAIAGALIGPKVTQDRAGLAALAGLFLVIPELAVLVFTGPGALLIAASLLTGAAYALFGVLWISALQRSVPGGILGRVLSLDALANSALQPLGI